MVTLRQWAGLAPALAIGLSNWFFQIFILNRFVSIRDFTKYELLALYLFVLGGYASFLAELCLLEENLLSLQLAASIFRTVVNWTAFLLVINESVAITRQQFGSLFLVLFTQGLWETQHILVLRE